MNKSYSKIRHIQEANVRLEKRMLKEEFDFNKIFESIATCASDNNVKIPESCSRFRNKPIGADIEPNALSTCIKDLKANSNQNFVKCLESKLGINITNMDINSMYNKGIDFLKQTFGGRRTPFDEKPF
jgi:hypothetical protein